MINIKKEFESECNSFRALVSNENILITKHISTKEFWLKNRNEFPNLAKLANILLNISASSEVIETFFSYVALYVM
jgi:hAT family C-terminal dimerisation region